MNRLSPSEQSRILACLVEGNSLRATCRMTGFAKKTVSRLLSEAGEACLRLMDEKMRNLPCEQIQCDEIWSFVYAKEKNVPKHLKGIVGDVWTWVAIDPVSKLIPAWYLGDRTAQSAYRFMHDLAPRLANRVQLTTDGHHAYLVAVRADFWTTSIDYAMLIKLYGDKESGKYSPGEVVGAEKKTISGSPKMSRVCTSHAERANLTMRMEMRRFTRLTNGFSKCLDGHRSALALHFAHYNFCRIHASLRVTPAMEAGLTDHIWNLEELAGLIVREERLAA